MANFKRDDKVTHPRVSGTLKIKQVFNGTREIEAGDDSSQQPRKFSVTDVAENFTLVPEPIRFGDRVRYVDEGDPNATHMVAVTWLQFGQKRYTIRYGLEPFARYVLTEAEVLERRIQ